MTGAAAATGAAIDASISTAVAVYVRKQVAIALAATPGARSLIAGVRVAF